MTSAPQVRLHLFGLMLALITAQAVKAKGSAPRGSLVATVTHVRDGDTTEIGGLPIRLQELAPPRPTNPVVPQLPRP